MPVLGSLRNGPATRRIALWFALAGAGVLVAAFGAFVAYIDGLHGAGAAGGGLWIAGGGALVGAVAAAFGRAAVRRHAAELEHLRASVLALTGDETLTPPPPPPAGSGAEIVGLHGALEALITHRRDLAADVERRLAQVLSALGDAILVVTDTGRVSLVNREALDLLGAERVAVGTSVFAALKPGPLNRAMDAAAAAEGTVRSEIVTNEDQVLRAEVTPIGEGAVVLSIPHEVAEAEHHFDHDLFLLDTVPEPPPVMHSTALADLPVFVMDTETTGLDVRADAIVSVGGVRMHGARIYRTANIDRLINPGRPVPPESTEIHGIDDRMLRGAPRFKALWPELRQLMAGCVLVGHNVAFDVAHLRRTMTEEGLRWTPPETLDTLLLAAAIDPAETALSLEMLAERYGIEVRGRHTALGDALVTAELYARFLPLLEDQGVETLGDALAFQQRAQSLIAMQRNSGWYDE